MPAVVAVSTSTLIGKEAVATPIVSGATTIGSHPKALWPGIKAFWAKAHMEELSELTDSTDVFSDTGEGQRQVPSYKGHAA